MKAFITGGTGLLGSNLARQLTGQGHQVTVLARSVEKAGRQLGGLGVTIVQGDIADVAAFAPALAGHDVLFHTAAYFREYFQPGDHWPILQRLNIDATIALLEAAERHGLRKAVHTSSSGIFGAPADGTPADETTPPDEYVLHNLYFKSKLLCEEAIQAFLKRSSLPVTIINPGWMFGPGDAAPTSAGQIILDYLNRNLPGVIDGGGAPVDVRDVAQAMIAAVDHGRSGERYIVGGDTFLTFREINAVLERVSGIPAPWMPIPHPVALAMAVVMENIAKLTGRPTLVTVDGVRTLRERRLYSSAKARRELGITFRPFEETLRDEVAWFREHLPERLSPEARRVRANVARIM